MMKGAVLEHRRAVTDAQLVVERTGIRFWSVTPERVRIEIEVENRGDTWSEPAPLRVQAAPFGAFLRWKPLVELTVPRIEPRGVAVLRTEARRSIARPRGGFSDFVPPVPPVLTARGMEDPAGKRRSRRRAVDGPGRLLAEVLAERSPGGHLPADLFEVLGRPNLHWAGNINVLVGRQAVERHLARAVRMHPGRTNLAMFALGANPQGYAMRVEGDAVAWEHDLLDVRAGSLRGQDGTFLLEGDRLRAGLGRGPRPGDSVRARGRRRVRPRRERGRARLLHGVNRGASRATLAMLLGAVVAGCRASGASGDPAAGTGGVVAPDVPRYGLVFTEDDAAVAEGLERDLDEGIRTVEAFFGRPFPAPFAVEVHPDRAAFTRSFPPEWGMPETECWMVAAGVADALRILSPRVWATDACEHDPRDAEHVRGIVAHELTHVFHGQHNPTGDFTGAEEVGWFAEGLAVVVSGQLETGHRASARQAVREGAVPRELEHAWSGPHRYGVCGTLVLYLDELLGRERLFELLPATTEGEILEASGLTEEELLAEWQAFVEVDAGR